MKLFITIVFLVFIFSLTEGKPIGESTNSVSGQGSRHNSKHDQTYSVTLTNGQTLTFTEKDLENAEVITTKNDVVQNKNL
ncbi:hypothetical protein BY458DRAFT_508986 [Sporodiniella umbellata]|nr:hypothetical protein BY458DRAFT_508986 [Sporodiniella umbellata]